AEGLGGGVHSRVRLSGVEGGGAAAGRCAAAAQTSTVRGLDEAGHREGDVLRGEAGADAGAQLALHAPLPPGRGLHGDTALVAVAVHGEDAGDGGGGEDLVGPGGVLGEVGADLLDHAGDELVVGLGGDV